ncbi:role in replication [Lactobacillus sp. CC-MHH1034]|uniref:role in replication n=1 Tax=Agrilactobacillus fermenti TaxID=2586909 RepID=UPI001E638720|nr:role in replication [Agrilactobacillus fermenti]MCD2255744.1 role in replication [Agrilactobacillus fermenti]
MKALYKGHPADVWQISRTNVRPDWVKLAFAEHYLYWLDNHLCILISGLKPSMTKNLKLGAVGTIGGGFAGYDMYTVGYLGDFLDATNHRVISKKTFSKKYQLLKDTSASQTEI